MNKELFEVIIESKIEHSNSSFVVEFVRDSWAEMSGDEKEKALKLLEFYPCGVCGVARNVAKTHPLRESMSTPKMIFDHSQTHCIIKMLKESRKEKISMTAFSQGKDAPESMLTLMKRVIDLSDTDIDASKKLLAEYLEKGWIVADELDPEKVSL